MRIYFLLIVSFLVFSCQIDIDDDNIKKIPVSDIEIPDEIVVNTNNIITFKYALINGCYSFYDIEYDDSNGDIRVITAFAIVEKNDVCTEIYRKEAYDLIFKPNEAKTYIFKFWTGQNNQGIDEYEEFELVVE